MIARVLVTGAGGYIGGALARRLAAEGHSVTGGIRRHIALPPGVTPLLTGDLADAVLPLTGLDAVVHAAGLGHRRGVSSELWQRNNVTAAAQVARQAKAAGVPRLILISTAHIHGRTAAGIVDDDSPPNPMDGYAASKQEAERQAAAIFGPDLTILRPVAVIGPGCPGNLQLLMGLLRRGIPLPFGAITNRRAFIAIEDLATLAALILASPSPPRTVLAASPETIATPELVRALAAGMGVPARLPSVPPALLAQAARALGRAAMWQSLAGDFVANPRAALALGWRPCGELWDELAICGRHYVVS